MSPSSDTQEQSPIVISSDLEPPKEVAVASPSMESMLSDQVTRDHIILNPCAGRSMPVNAGPPRRFRADLLSDTVLENWPVTDQSINVTRRNLDLIGWANCVKHNRGVVQTSCVVCLLPLYKNYYTPQYLGTGLAALLKASQKACYDAVLYVASPLPFGPRTDKEQMTDERYPQLIQDAIALNPANVHPHKIRYLPVQDLFLRHTSKVSTSACLVQEDGVLMRAGCFLLRSYLLSELGLIPYDGL